MTRTRTTLHIVIIALSLAMMISIDAQQREPRASLPQEIEEVRSLDDIRPRTLDERTRAKHFRYESPNKVSAYESRIVSLGPVDVGLTAPPPPRVSTTPPDPLERWRKKVCISPAVILGQPISTKTFLNEQETFLYTNYEIAIERWIRPTSNSALIVASKLGGAVRVNGKLLSYSTGFAIETGKLYILFLRQIPNTKFFEIGEALTREIGNKNSIPSASDASQPVDDSFIKQLVTLAEQCKGAPNAFSRAAIQWPPRPPRRSKLRSDAVELSVATRLCDNLVRPLVTRPDSVTLKTESGVRVASV